MPKLPSLDEARTLAKGGLFFVCATCPRWHEGRALGMDRCTGKACGSPIRRKDFPEYAGELKDFSKLCFACGDEGVLAYAFLQGSQRKFGLCRSHLELIDDLIESPGSISLPSNPSVMIVPNAEKVLKEHEDAQVEL